MQYSVLYTRLKRNNEHIRTIGEHTRGVFINPQSHMVSLEQHAFSQSQSHPALEPLTNMLVPVYTLHYRLAKHRLHVACNLEHTVPSPTDPQ